MFPTSKMDNVSNQEKGSIVLEIDDDGVALSPITTIGKTAVSHGVDCCNP